MMSANTNYHRHVTCLINRDSRNLKPLISIQIGIASRRTQGANRVDLCFGKVLDQTNINFLVHHARVERRQWEGAKSGKHYGSFSQVEWLLVDEAAASPMHSSVNDREASPRLVDTVHFFKWLLRSLL
jgi:hypothetical protein